MKTCTRCKVEKDESLFSKNRKTKDALQHHCKACKLEYQRNNPNRAGVTAKYRAVNREVCTARSVASMAKKREYYTEKSLQWAAENRERHLANRRRRYQRVRAAEVERQRRRDIRIRDALNLSRAYQAEIQGMYDFCRVFRGFEVDHIAPLNGHGVCGLHAPWNLQVLPVSENRSKGNKFDAEACAPAFA
jgi:hypothetical protein